MNKRRRELTGPFRVIRHDERSKTVAIDQDGVVKRYFTSQIRLFLEQPSMLDDSTTDRKFNDSHFKTDDDRDEPELDGDNVLLNVDQQSYEQESITD